MIGLISGSVSAAARTLGHLISFCVTLALMILVNAYICWTLKNRPQTQGCWAKYGPLILTILAVPFIMADLTRHLLQDHDIWPECERPTGVVWNSSCTWSSSQYHCEKAPPNGCIDTTRENLAHLSMIGVLFTICFTYTGFLLLMVGSMWNANLCQKCRDMRSQWRELRSGSVNSRKDVD